MEKNQILPAICAMVADDNQGVKMSTTLTDVKDDPRGAIVSFGVERESGSDAKLQLHGLPGKYMVCCFFIDKNELEKYKV